MEGLGALWSRVADPARSFAERRRRDPALGASLREMLLLRTPPAFVALAFEYASFRELYGRLADPGSEFWAAVLRQAPGTLDPLDLREALRMLPALPQTGRLLPWFLLASPLLALSLWAHDVTFDHAALWVLRGLGGGRGWRGTMSADAEALKAGVFAAAFGALAALPFVPAPVALLAVPVAGYFWVLRGFALAAWHGIPLWKGVAATLLHVVLALAALLVLAAAAVILALALAG